MVMAHEASDLTTQHAGGRQEWRRYELQNTFNFLLLTFN
jgi:hypothetical protein